MNIDNNPYIVRKYEPYVIKYHPPIKKYRAYDSEDNNKLVAESDSLRQIKTILKSGLIEPRESVHNPKHMKNKDKSINDSYMGCDITFNGKLYKAFCGICESHKRDTLIAESNSLYGLEEKIYNHFHNKKVALQKRQRNSAVRINPKSLKGYAKITCPVCEEKIKIYEDAYGDKKISQHNFKNNNTWDGTICPASGQFVNKTRKNISIANNPLRHFPRTRAGRPRGRGRPRKLRPATTFPTGKGRRPSIEYWILDLYNSKDKISNTLIGEGAKSNAEMEAQKYAKQRGISRVVLSGPYSKRPNKNTKRK